MNGNLSAATVFQHYKDVPKQSLELDLVVRPCFLLLQRLSSLHCKCQRSLTPSTYMPRATTILVKMASTKAILTTISQRNVSYW
jgi:hypothetical protein